MSMRIACISHTPSAAALAIFQPVLLSIALAVCPAAQSPRYDGRWWNTASADQRDGFLSGYLDCYVYDARGNDYSGRSIQQQIAEVSVFYRARPERLETLVAEVVRGLTGPHDRRPTARHGAYDGEFWRQTSLAGRTAFIAGYLACQTGDLHAAFPASPEAYARAISAWYGISDTDESQLNEKRANDKIGDILLRWRGKPAPK
jgi:hypothetical protein